MSERAKRAIAALREPDASLARVVNTVRQSIAEVIEHQQILIDVQADRTEALVAALRASRLVLIERGLDPKSRIVGVIDTALAPEQDK